CELQIYRRTLLEYLGAVVFTPVLANSKEASGMWGMIAKIILLPGRRDEMIEILKESAADMPGCLSYVVAKDVADENTIWVTEVYYYISISFLAAKISCGQTGKLLSGGALGRQDGVEGESTVAGELIAVCMR